MRRTLGVLLLLGVMAGCSAPMLSSSERDWAKGKVAEPGLFSRPSDHTGERRILGGVILGVRQEPGGATIRLLAYPLDKKYYPETGSPPLGPATILWTGPPLSTLFLSGNRIAVEGTVLPTEDKSDQRRTIRIKARILSPDTCVSAKGLTCQRTILGCRCEND